jgi:hypothetical protein
MTYGFGGSLLVAAIAYAFKPDTSYVLSRFCYLFDLLRISCGAE